jgi:hypothetical protein
MKAKDNPLILDLIRVNKTQEYTEGALIYVNENEILCDTLEDKIIDANGNGKIDGDEVKVYGESAIPYGEYDIEVTYSPKFKKDMVLVKNVDSFEGIRMHYAASAKQLEGCVGVGKKNGLGRLKNTNMTNYLVTLLKAHNNKGKLRVI